MGGRHANWVCFTVRRRMKSLTRNKHTKTKELVVPCLSLPFPFPPLKKEKEIRILYSFRGNRSVRDRSLYTTTTFVDAKKTPNTRVCTNKAGALLSSLHNLRHSPAFNGPETIVRAPRLKENLLATVKRR